MIKNIIIKYWELLPNLIVYLYLSMLPIHTRIKEHALLQNVSYIFIIEIALYVNNNGMDVHIIESKV